MFKSSSAKGHHNQLDHEFLTHYSRNATTIYIKAPTPEITWNAIAAMAEKMKRINDYDCYPQEHTIEMVVQAKRKELMRAN